MVGNKVYFQPSGTVLAVISDIVELQKGKFTFSDTPHGKIHFFIKMYGNKWELQFTATEIEKNNCNVKIEIVHGAFGSNDLIQREFALLDSMLLLKSPAELSKEVIRSF